MIALPVGKILINCCHHVFICACGCSSFPVSSHHHVSVCPVYCHSHCRLIFPLCSCPFLHTFSSFLKPSVRPVLRQMLSRSRHVRSTGAALHESQFRIIPMCLTAFSSAPFKTFHLDWLPFQTNHWSSRWVGCGAEPPTVNHSRTKAWLTRPFSVDSCLLCGCTLTAC